MINSLNRSNIIINNNTEKECAVMQGNLSFMINATYQLEGWHGGRQGDLNEQGDGWHGGRQVTSTSRATAGTAKCRPDNQINRQV